MQDSSKNAIQLLAQDVDLSEKVEGVPDPEVQWVWLVIDHGKKAAFIVYLADEDWEEMESYEKACKYLTR